MTFVQMSFLAFMLIVFVLYWGVGKRTWQNVLLLVASAMFYGWVHPWFLGLLYFSAFLDYNVGRAMAERPAQKKWFLGLSLAGNLGMLGLFKYFNFFTENLGAALSALGLDLNLWTLNLILPVGISFYTFQTLSYTIDVYKGRIEPRKNLLDYLVYVSFFPQLVAGPIERASSLLPQVERPRHFDTQKIMSGLTLALWGAFKKVVIADGLAPYVDEVYMAKDPAFVMVMAAGIAFGVQMLADIGGYTDMARGTARMLGFELVRNFDRPYNSLTTPEFWRKWHMSLSSWVGDYVYTPLLRAGKAGPGRIFLSLMVTFLLIGLWHGASWNFICLGLYNGLWMAIYTFATPAIPLRIREHWTAPLIAWPLHTFVVLQPTGVMFREVSMERVFQHFSQPWLSATTEELVAATVVFSMAVAGTLPINLSYAVEDHVIPRLKASGWLLPAQTTFMSVAVVAMFIFHRDVSEDFIYFQF